MAKTSNIFRGNYKKAAQSNFVFFPHSTASLVVAQVVTKEKKVLEKSQTNNIFKRVTMEKMYEI